MKYKLLTIVREPMELGMRMVEDHRDVVTAVLPTPKDASYKGNMTDEQLAEACEVAR